MFLYEESMIFFLGFLIMLLFALWFFANRRRSEYFMPAFLVTAITAMSQALMLDASVTVTSQSGQLVYFTRWLFYIASCSLLMLSIAKFVGTAKKNLLAVVVLNSLVMLSGALAAIFAGPLKWTVFMLGSVFFIVQLYLLFEGTKSGRSAQIVWFYIIGGWMLFPVVFIFAPEGLGMVSNLLAASLYFVLDMFTKIVFYLHLAYAKIK